MKYIFYSVLAICITVLAYTFINKVPPLEIALTVFVIAAFLLVIYIVKRFLDFLGF